MFVSSTTHSTGTYGTCTLSAQKPAREEPKKPNCLWA